MDQEVEVDGEDLGEALGQGMLLKLGHAKRQGK